MNYKKGFLKVVREDIMSSGGTFGSVAGIGTHGGAVGNDSTAYGSGKGGYDNMNLWGAPLDPNKPKSHRQKKSRGKRSKREAAGKAFLGRASIIAPLYRREFVELMNTECIDWDSLILDCVVGTANSSCNDVLKEILTRNRVPFEEHKDNVISFQGTEKIINAHVDHLLGVIGQDNAVVMIGEMDESKPNEVDNVVKGGKADSLSIEDIAKKHGIDVASIEKELKMGREVELEHTNDHDLAEEIALDHLTEFPQYYTELAKMEDRLKKQNV